MFSIENSVTLETLEEQGADAFIIPPEDMFDYEKVEISGGQLRRVLNGNCIRYDGTEGKMYRIFDTDGKFLCVSRLVDGQLVMEKSFY